VEKKKILSGAEREKIRLPRKKKGRQIHRKKGNDCFQRKREGTSLGSGEEGAPSLARKNEFRISQEKLCMVEKKKNITSARQNRRVREKPGWEC